ncbi:MAG: type I-U CRISPR-associated protein Cas7 [Phycisphaerae bacterium]|nr:MAG: type I-U CRISPR-associated protein Cas7 [Phycisphaerae bacterium]
MDYDALKNAPRLLMEAKLKPLQGHRFQSTGFADLGPARYTLPDGTEMLLVESAQSVANRMELACWDAAAEDLIAELRGLPYIRITGADNGHLSNSLLEAHRINSEYVMKEARRVSKTDGKRKVAEKPFNEEFAAEIGYQKDGRVDWKKFHAALLKYDPNSLIHGCFLEEIGGRLRATRTLSGFIEATGVVVAESGGVKNNIVQPELKGGEGNVPFHRTEFVARELKAYFNLDLALLRGYGLPAEATQLLIALSLFKIRRFLSAGLRLRTACDLEIAGDGLVATRPNDFKIASEANLLTECTRLIKTCAGLFADPPITEVEWKPVKKKGGKGGKGEGGAEGADENADDSARGDEEGDDQ